jgi:Ser/Thr protein kinase RdoA (MazF antagonist)
MLEQVLPLWVFEKDVTAVPFGNGLINHTWKVVSGTEAFILQKINDQVFRNPEAIATNISHITDYLSAHAPQYVFPAPVKTTDGREMADLPELGYFRLFPFIENTHSIDVVATPKQAFEAAKAFGRFTKTLSGLDPSRLAITIPHFHDLTLRYNNLQAAAITAAPERAQQAAQLFQFLMQHQTLVSEYERLIHNESFKVRVTHHDTKISNVLFDAEENSVCVIDLDTVMPGYFISDVGDMLRTYLCPYGEEEQDLSKISIREDYFNAIVRGYLGEMNNELTATEKDAFVFAGKFLIYMQAVRFLTDYLNNDVYYGARYEEHNLVRAQNQAVLLQRLCEKESVLQGMVADAATRT